VSGCAFTSRRSDDLVFIQMTVNETRTLAQKKALYRRLVALLTENPGLRPEDVFINLLQVPLENWSVGLRSAIRAGVIGKPGLTVPRTVPRWNRART